MKMNRGGRGKRPVVLKRAAVALLAMTSSLLPLVKADAQNFSQNEDVCQWDGKEGKEKCKQHEKVEAEISEEEKDWDEIGEKDDDYIEWAYLQMIRHFGEFASIPEEGEAWNVWKHGTNNHIYKELECPDDMSSDTSFNNIHSTETWQTFNRIYNEVIAATQGDEELQQESTIPEKFEKNGFQFPVEVKFDEVKGRGVYSKGHVPKGSLLYISTNNGAFLNGQTYRNFLKALPPELACDVSIWAFVRWVSLESEETDAHMVCVDLDEGSFTNSADSDSAYNMALGNDAGKFFADMDEEEEVELWHGCKMKFYAYRDIEEGEEILASYADFVEQGGWSYLGLGLS